MGELRLASLFNALLYAVVGIGLFAVIFVLIDRLTPYKLWVEIGERRNTALAILLGAMSIGICLIIAMAVH